MLFDFDIEEDEALRGRKNQSGQASAIVAYSKRAFVEILGKYEVPVFDYPADELVRFTFSIMTLLPGDVIATGAPQASDL